jgi:hypothetical protein
MYFLRENSQGFLNRERERSEKRIAHRTKKNNREKEKKPKMKERNVDVSKF